MSQAVCERELDVMDALDAGQWPADLASHVDTCLACQQVRAIGPELLRYAREEAAVPLPDPGDLWWRARLDARREARRRSMQPIDTVERAEPFVAAAAVLLMLVLRGDAVMNALVRWTSGGTVDSGVQLAMPGLVLPVLIGGLVATALMLLVSLGAAFSRD